MHSRKLWVFLTLSTLPACQSIAKRSQTGNQSSMVMSLPSDMPDDLKSKISGYNLEIVPADSTCKGATDVKRAEAWDGNKQLSQSIAKNCDYTLVLEIGVFGKDSLETIYLTNRNAASEGTPLRASEFANETTFRKNISVHPTQDGINAGFDRVMPQPSQSPSPPPQSQVLKVTVKGGYSPDTLTVKKGIPIEIQFYRDEKSGCSSQLVIKDFGISQALPAFQTTTVKFTANKTGAFRFTCGMDMLDGKLIVTE